MENGEIDCYSLDPTCVIVREFRSDVNVCG